MRNKLIPLAALLMLSGCGTQLPDPKDAAATAFRIKRGVDFAGGRR